MTEKVVMGIEQTLDVFEYANKLLDSFIASKKDDGKVDKKEIMIALLSSIPEAVKAYAGSSQIDDELNDMSSEEMMKIAQEGSKLAKKLVDLFLMEGSTPK